MYSCSSREKTNEKLIIELQNAVAQLRQEVRRSNDAASDLVGAVQKTLQKCVLRVAEVEVELENSKNVIAKLEGDVYKSSQLSEAVSNEVIKSKEKILVVDETLHKSNRHLLALEDTLHKSSKYMLSVEDRLRSKVDNEDVSTTEGIGSARGSLNDGSMSEKRLPMPSDQESSIGGSPSLVSASFVKTRSVQDRVSSLETLVSNLWHFHVNFFLLPVAGPAEPPHLSSDYHSSVNMPPRGNAVENLRYGPTPVSSTGQYSHLSHTTYSVEYKTSDGVLSYTV